MLSEVHSADGKTDIVQVVEKAPNSQARLFQFNGERSDNPGRPDKCDGNGFRACNGYNKKAEDDRNE